MCFPPLPAWPPAARCYISTWIILQEIAGIWVGMYEAVWGVWVLIFGTNQYPQTSRGYHRKHTDSNQAPTLASNVNHTSTWGNQSHYSYANHTSTWASQYNYVRTKYSQEDARNQKQHPHQPHSTTTPYPHPRDHQGDHSSTAHTQYNHPTTAPP